MLSHSQIKSLGTIVFYKSLFDGECQYFGSKVCPPYDVKQVLKMLQVEATQEESLLIEKMFNYLRYKDWFFKTNIGKDEEWLSENMVKLREELKDII